MMNLCQCLQNNVVNSKLTYLIYSSLEALLNINVIATLEQPVELFGCQYFRRLPHRNLSILFPKIAIIPENASREFIPGFSFPMF